MDRLSDDDRAYLLKVGAQEQTTLAALRATRASFEGHLAEKYGLKTGDQIQPDGAIVRAAKAPE